MHKTITLLATLLIILLPSIPPVGEKPPDIQTDETLSLTLKIRYGDIDFFKTRIPFKLGGYTAWRLVQLDKTGDNTPRDWLIFCRLDLYLTPEPQQQ